MQKLLVIISATSWQRLSVISCFKKKLPYFLALNENDSIFSKSFNSLILLTCLVSRRIPEFCAKIADILCSQHICYKVLLENGPGCKPALSTAGDQHSTAPWQSTADCQQAFHSQQEVQNSAQNICAQREVRNVSTMNLCHMCSA